MAVEIKMPQLSDTMDEGTILSWLKKEGEEVSRGDMLAEVATDKADLEIESFHEGVLLSIQSPEGATVKVGEVIALIGEQGEKVSAAPKSNVVEIKETPAPEPANVSPAPAPAPAQQAAAPQNDARVKISPLARNLASSYGVDYSNINGTGEGGRIVKRDIEAAAGGQQAAPAPQAAPAVAPAPVQAPTAVAPVSGGAPSVQPLSRMRSTIASQMVKSTSEIPHFYVQAKLEVDALANLRASLKPLPQYEGITFNHLMIKAVGLALRAHPRINACYQNDSLVQPQDVNVGIVTALEDGLLIPVVKHADSNALADIVQDARNLVQRARSGRPKPDDLLGGTFSISNIGRLEVENFTAIINPSQGAILAVGSMQEEPLVKDGALSIGKVMRVCLSVDHRIIDGLVAGEFLTELKRLIEDPVLLLA